MQAIIRLFVEIALHRKGPQDVPAAGALLGLSLAAYLAIGALALLPQTTGATMLLGHLAVDLVMVFLVFGGLLLLTGRAGRARQTLTALFGTGALLSAAALPFIWLAAGALDDSGPVGGREATALLSMMVLFGLLVASLLVTGHIVRHALDWSYPVGVLTAVLYFAASVALFRYLFPAA
jgi:hypothetical protein